MASAAASADTSYAGGNRRVIPMAIIAGGRAKVTALEQRTSMDTRLIFGKLRCRQGRTIRSSDAGHCSGIGMAGAASFGNALRIDFREWIFGGANPMDTMATHARGCTVCLLYTSD